MIGAFDLGWHRFGLFVVLLFGLAVAMAYGALVWHQTGVALSKGHDP